MEQKILTLPEYVIKLKTQDLINVITIMKKAAVPMEIVEPLVIEILKQADFQEKNQLEKHKEPNK